MSTLDRYLAFRRSLGGRPSLEHRVVRARGLDGTVYLTPPVAGALPLLCINGGLVFDHTLLWPALAALASHRSVIFFDQRGRGCSGSPPGMQASRIEFDASDVPALRTALGIPRWDVLGHSWGGGTAMLATAQEQRVAFDTATLASYAQAFFPAWFADQQFAGRMTAPRGTSPLGAAVAARRRRDGYDWRGTLRDLPTPTLVVHGAADVLPLAEAERTAAHLGRARLLPIAEAGHHPFWEAPDAFFTAVHAFLTEGSPDS
jgi:proline iminopeptidase